MRVDNHVKRLMEQIEFDMYERSKDDSRVALLKLLAKLDKNLERLIVEEYKNRDYFKLSEYLRILSR